MIYPAAMSVCGILRLRHGPDAMPAILVNPPPAADTAVDSTTAREQQFFDSLVRDQGSFNPFSDRGWQTLERRFLEFVCPKGHERLLDIGCGTGESRKLYYAHVASYTGVDLSKESIEFAKQRFPACAWKIANACELPFEDSSFDLVAFSSVLHHIDNYEDALAEAHRVLKAGGRVFAFDPNARHPAMALFRNPDSPFYLSEGVSPNERPLQASELASKFRTTGFADIQQRCQSDIPYRAVAPRLINSVLTAYNAVDRFWEAVGLGRHYGTFVVTSGTRSGTESHLS
jgi:SAM-dependent methyltransferase